MGKVIIINGSPRATKSNSKRYGDIFRCFYKGDTDTFNITKNNHNDICSKIEEYSDILFIFPLYADGIPVTLLNINIMINCGFIEPSQNEVCIDMIRLFCKQNRYTFGSVLSIGSGEAILDTPFRFLVRWKIKRLSKSIYNNRFESLNITMPISKKLFIKASTNYWVDYGKRNGITKSEMETMKIE